MKLSTVEKLLLVLTAAFVAFLSGLYFGRNMAADSITVYTQKFDSDQISSTSPGEPDAPEDADEPLSFENKLNLNTAAASELSILPGIGEVLAERIVVYRHEHGNFSSIEEIMDVSGIGEAKFNAMKDYIIVEE